MPSEHPIYEGPSGLDFILGSHAITGKGQTSEFSFKNWPEGSRNRSFVILTIGREFGTYVSVNLDEYCFTAVSQDPQADPKTTRLCDKNCYIVGVYNSRAKKGNCTRYTWKEILSDPVVRKLFPNTALDFDKEMAMIGVQGGYRIISVAVCCSEIHKSRFLNIVTESSKARHSKLEEAELIITDDPSVILPHEQARPRPEPHFALYGMTNCSESTSSKNTFLTQENYKSELHNLISLLASRPLAKA